LCHLIICLPNLLLLVPGCHLLVLLMRHGSRRQLPPAAATPPPPLRWLLIFSRRCRACSLVNWVHPPLMVETIFVQSPAIKKNKLLY
jgi:hypothetical protein